MNQWQRRAQLRIGDAERQESLQLLGEHFAEGRLDREEYDERCQRVWSAKTGADLDPLFVDLPGQRPGMLAPRGPASLPARAPKRRARVPLLPVLLLLIGVAIITGKAWIFPIGLLGWWVFHRAVGHRAGHHHARGS